MPKPKHLNTGDCDKCDALFEAYPGFHAGLRTWFKALQKRLPDAHISQAGRGKKDQEEYFRKGTSKARYGQSSHNFNAAIDLFRLVQTGADWDKFWFEARIAPEVLSFNKDPKNDFKLNWYGSKGHAFYELPHIEVEGWKTLGLKKVE